MAIRNKCYNTCFYLHDRFSFRKLFLVRHCTLHILGMGGAYPYMDLNAKYEQFYNNVLLRLNRIDPNYLQNEASAREIATCKQNVRQKEDFMH